MKTFKEVIFQEFLLNYFILWSLKFPVETSEGRRHKFKVNNDSQGIGKLQSA